MNKFRVVTPLALVVAGGLAYAAFSAGTPTAQAQANDPDADLSARVEQLTKQVQDLQKKVDQLQQKRPPIVIQSYPSSARALPPSLKKQPNQAPRNWSPFEFGGQTYYVVPAK